MQICWNFCWKNVSSFCSAKATHIFSAKNIRILYIESAKTLNKITLNELVKLTTLWTTGPRSRLGYGSCCMPLVTNFKCGNIISEDLLTLVLLNPDMPCLCKQCRSRCLSFIIWICMNFKCGNIISEDLLTLVLLNPDMPCLCKQCRSRCLSFIIWICINSLAQVNWLAEN